MGVWKLLSHHSVREFTSRPSQSAAQRLTQPKNLHQPMNTPERNKLLQLLQTRFDQHMQRHAGVVWAEVRSRLEGNPAALQSLLLMENSGGEPDVIGGKDSHGHFTFADCAAESPAGRRSLCYDAQALLARRENKPAGSAHGMASSMGVQLLNEEQYRALQELGPFDLKTSSWVHTPDDMRALDGALFCDRRFGRVFTYHNGVQSYYAGRGFRAWLQV